jgi:hypothetical protein
MQDAKISNVSSKELFKLIPEFNIKKIVLKSRKI